MRGYRFQIVFCCLKQSVWQGKQHIALGTRGYRLRAILKKNLQVNTISASSKSRQRARPSLWQCSAKASTVRTFYLPKPRPGNSPGSAYGRTLWGNSFQRVILGAFAKARLVARPGLWPCTVGKQFAKKYSRCIGQKQATRLAQPMSLHYSKTAYKETF